MDRSEIIEDIKKRLPGFSELSSSQDHPDEICIRVGPQAFGEACLALHKILPSPVMTLFAVDERRRRNIFEIRCVFLAARRSCWITVAVDIASEDPSFDSLARRIHSASLFEREIREMFGIEPRGNPDVRRLNLHDEVWPAGAFPLRKDFAKDPVSAGAGEYIFNRVEGEGIFEVPVGPVHAGIIGPGHFRFSVAGEPIINLEPRLGFTHRGVEKLFEGRTPSDAIALAECVSGDSACAHSLAFAMAAEKIYGAAVSARVSYTRAILLELERLYNHVNDIGGMAVDVGFSFPAAYASIIKEAILRLNEKITLSRYLKTVNKVGGISVALDEGKKRLIEDSLKLIGADFTEVMKILRSSVSFMDRVDTTGVLRRKTAEDLGVVGLVGRASGIPVDLRSSFFAGYKEAKFSPAVEQSGDVLARLKVRASEFGESCRLIRFFLEKVSPEDPGPVTTEPRAGQALGYAEGWRGPVLYWLKTDEAGLIERCKVVDPSFHNWQALSYAVLGNIIPDFPLCNKSFDLSYSGNDL